MQYQVLVQTHPGKNFVASVLGVADCVADGPTKEAAIANARNALAERLAQGEIFTIEVEMENTATDNPWLKNFGRLREDPTFDDFLAEIAAHRRLTAETE